MSGSITLTLTGQDGTSTTVVCAPSTIAFGGSVTCTVTVKDLATTGAATASGTVSFSNATSGQGTFTPPGGCALSSSGNCSVTFKPATGPATIPVYAAHGGDATHYPSSGATWVYVTAPLDD